MRDPRRLVAVLLLGLLISVGGATALRNAEAGDVVADDPGLSASASAAASAAAAAAAAAAATSSTVAPETTVAPPRLVSQANGPVRVPKDPYAAEPLVELGTIEIPKIGLKHRIFEGITLRTIDNGPSHWPGTAMPGQRGNAVFAGHRVTHSHPFRNIDQLTPGDEVIFTIGEKRSVYKVTGSKVVTPKELDIVTPTSTATATIFGCHPPGSAKFRYVVLMSLAEEAPSPTPVPAPEAPPDQPAF